MPALFFQRKEMKVAIYIRVSTEEQNPKIQEDICKQYCERMEYEIFDVYSDVYSGYTDQRPEFNRLLEDMRAFKFDAVMVTKLDRMGRSLQHLLTLFDEFKHKRIGFIAVQQNIDTTTSMGRLQFQILGAFAEFERNLISERTKDALKGNERVGKRGKDKRPRNRSGYFLRHKKKKKAPKLKARLYRRTCKRCRERFETPLHTAKICKNCWGKKEGI